MKMKKVAALGAAVGVALAGVALAAPASAEPVSNSYVLVGSDTLQDSSNALTNGTSVSGATVRITAGGVTVGSFDAFGAAAIQTKPNGPYFGRPAGSGAGVTALRASITGNAYSAGGGNTTPARVITGQVDVARSSSGPGSNANAAGQLLYVPYARDAVAYAYKGGTSAWANLTQAQLKQIFDGTLTTIDGVAVNPRLPQPGSGTRAFWITALGYPSGTTAVPGVSDVGNTTPENDATVLAAGDLIPFSAASWIAQSNGVTGVSTITGTGASLGSPLGATDPYTGTAPNLVANSAYYTNTTFGRDTYLVVEWARVTEGQAKYDPALAGLVDSTKATSLTNFSAVLPSQPGSVKRKFGFLAPSTTVPQRAFATL